MNFSPNDFRLAGAVPLDRRPAAQPAPPRPAGSNVVDVTEATFQAEVVDRSMSTLVVLDFWASWCEPCKQLSPILERLAAADGGAWVLAKIDVDANQQLAAAAAVQGIPAVKAVWQGQIVHEFNGAMPETQVRAWLDQLLTAVGAERSAAGDGDQPDGAEDLDPGYEQAMTALDAGDLDAAAAAYTGVLERLPGDPLAKAGLGQVELLRRTSGLDPAAVRERADAYPEDVQAQCDAADLELLGGQLAEAFARLVATVRRTSGDDRASARTHLVALFDAVGGDDPRVVAARTALANALF